MTATSIQGQSVQLNAGESSENYLRGDPAGFRGIGHTQSGWIQPNPSRELGMTSASSISHNCEGNRIHRRMTSAGICREISVLPRQEMVRGGQELCLLLDPSHGQIQGRAVAFKIWKVGM